MIGPQKLSRRSLVAGAAAAMALPKSVRAEVSCNTFAHGRVCTAGIPSWQIENVAISSQQRMQNWCWAACMQMVFRHHGHDVSQSHIVSRVFGGLMNEPLPGYAIAQAVSATWTDTAGHHFTPQARVLIDSQFDLRHSNAGGIAINDMIQGQPLIVGTEGHATIITNITFSEGPNRPTIIRDVVVRDPWPYGPNRRSLSESQFVNTDFLMQVRI